MARPPKKYFRRDRPLHHTLYYAAGLDMETTTKNTTYLTIAKHYKTVTDATTIAVNPRHASFAETETGAICQRDSILTNLKIRLRFSWIPDNTYEQGPVLAYWQPIYNSYPEKLDAADEKTSTTVAALLDVTKDATQEDVTPTWNGTDLSTTGASDRLHPVSSVNATETFTMLNLTTDKKMEGVDHDEEAINLAAKYYTNKGALKSCLGRRRYFTVTKTNNVKNFFIRKRMPMAVERIVPYSFFGIIVHVPTTTSSASQYYQGGALTAGQIHLGLTARISYDEWNNDFNQEMT